MNKTIKIQVSIPETKVGLFYAAQSVQLITNGLSVADRYGAVYNVKAMHDFTKQIRGAVSTYDFEITIDNQFISDEDEETVLQEIINSLPTTHKIIVQPTTPDNYTDSMNITDTADKQKDAENFFQKVKEIDPAIGGSINEKLIIKGTYRGKATCSYAYSFAEHRFL